jgi:hypothetical protein
MRETHDLFLTGPTEHGVGEWLCYQCGRRILVKFAPGFARIVLVPGEEAVMHKASVAGKNIINMPAGCIPFLTEQDGEWLAGNGMMWGEDGS